jgi:MFS family permease
MNQANTGEGAAAGPAMGRGELRSARISLGVLLLINLFNYIDRFVLTGVEPLIREEFFPKGSEGEANAKFWMGSLATAFLLTYMLTAPIFGWLADRFRRWTIVGVGVLLWTLATGASGLATGFLALLLFRVLVGVGEAAWGPTAPTIIADMYPAHRRGAVMSWFYVAIPVGSALGFVIGGQMAHLVSWHWAFFVVVPPGLVLGVWALTRPEPARGRADPGAARRRMTMADVWALASNRSYAFCTLGMTAMTFAIGGMSFWMPTYIHEYRLGGGTDATGTAQLAHVNLVFGGITVVAGLLGTIIGGYASDALRARLRGAYFTFSGLAMLASFPFFLGVLFAPFPWAWVFMFLAIFCVFLNTGPTNTIIANVVHPSLRGTAYAINILVIHALGDAISPPLIGLISDQTKSMSVGFGVVGVAMVVSGAVWLLGARHLERDTRAITDGTWPAGDSGMQRGSGAGGSAG